AGYTGGMLAERLVRSGEDVIVTRRDPGNASAAVQALIPPGGRLHSGFVRGVAVDLTDAGSVAGLIPDNSIVVCTAPPGDDPVAEMTRLLAVAHSAARIVYVSSTGVYGPARGAWVDESTPIAPHTRAGRARAAAEAQLGGHAIALRVAGIHGPGRGLVERIRGGTYRIVGDGSAHVSRIHVVDLVEAIVRAGTSKLAGPVNVADDDPAPIGEVADAVAAHLGLAPPPRVPADAVDPEVAGMLTADRRIANRRMKEELGVELRYPSWRSVLGADA
ncbi:MAG TPA: NAD-dependent epimerase/dehydratase family protein, partial [Kofleriaceae bacterium]